MNFKIVNRTVLVTIGIPLLFTSCTTLKSRLHRGYIEEGKAKQEINLLNSKHVEELKIAVDKISAEKDKLIVGQDNQLQSISNSLYGANLAFSFYSPPEPSRVDLIINNRVTEAASITGKKATADAMDAENVRLKTELDEKITSLEDLKKTHEIVISKNIELVQESEIHKQEISKLNSSILDINSKYLTDLAKKQQELISKQDKINSLEKERADDAEWIRLIKLKAMAVCGLLALVCVAGSIWSPVFKSKFIIGATVFGGCAALIMYIQPWQIGIIVGAAILAIIIKMAYEHNAMEKTATNAIHFIEDTKETNPTGIDKNKLTDYMGRYVTDKTGKVSTEPDPDVEKIISDKLRASNKL